MVNPFSLNQDRRGGRSHAPDEVIAHVLAHHERQRAGQSRPPAPPAPGYRPEVLAALFGTSALGGGR